MTKFREMAATVSLHGLGFLQVKLGGNQRLHVWHPALPRRDCYEYSSIHDHRFGFDSTVLVGMQVNDVFSVYEPNVGGLSADHEWTHNAYLHEGARSAQGNRPWWIQKEKLWVGHVSRELVDAGGTYHMLPHVFHSTTPGGDGRVATLMTKTTEGTAGARSLCERDREPHVDFDRFQLSRDEMWNIIRDVIGK